MCRVCSDVEGAGLTTGLCHTDESGHVIIRLKLQEVSGMLEQGEGFAEADGVRLHYRVQGEGPACLVHPGGPGSDSRYFADLAGISAFLTLIYLDPRGTGASTAPSDATRYELPDYAADVEAIRKHLDLYEFILLGHSHGGMVAQQYALDYPGRLSHLILANTAPALSADTGKRMLAAVERRKDEPWYTVARAAFDKEWRGEFENGDDLADLFAAELPFYFREWDDAARRYAKSIEGMTFNVDALQRFNMVEVLRMDLRPRLSEIRTPTLVLTGEDDFICDVHSAREMAERIPNSKLRVLEACGHFTFVDKPERFRELVREFVLPQRTQSSQRV